VTDSSDDEDDAANKIINEVRNEFYVSVTALQASIPRYLKIRAKPSRERTFDRFRLWLSKNINYRDINEISNSDAKHVGGSTYNPNLPGFGSRYIDCCLADLKVKTFTAKSYAPDSEEERASVSVTTHFRDFEEGICTAWYRMRNRLWVS